VTGFAIETRGLTKYYGSVRGVEKLDLEVLEGEIYGFLGPNGAGKTTTLRLLLDLLRPDRGSALVLGMDVHGQRAGVHRQIGYLPGELAMWPELTGKENLEYLARLRGGVDRKFLSSLMERFDVDLSKRFRAYSRGNKQKIGLIQAFMHKPRLLLLDEPTSGLDPLVQNSFHELLLEVAAEGRTVFLSSHVLSEVERMCDRAGIIRAGRLVRSDKVTDLQMGARHVVRMSFEGHVDPEVLRRVPGVSSVEEEQVPSLEGAGSTHSASSMQVLVLDVAGDMRPVLEAALGYSVAEFESRRPSLEELFMSYYGDHQEDADA
jgi:ABC-2 type transport system ATP-binding protein